MNKDDRDKLKELEDRIKKLEEKMNGKTTNT